MAELYWIRTADMTDMRMEGYIGMSSISAKVRWNAHRSSAKLDEKAHLPIYRAFRKYGADNLVMSVLVAGPDGYITELESKLRPTEGIGWNCAQGGQDPGKGRTHSKESREKRAAKMRGRKLSEDVKKRMSESMKGIPKSPEHIEKIRLTKVGFKHSDKTLEKMRKASLGSFDITHEGRAALSKFQKELPPWKRSRSVMAVWTNAIGVFSEYGSDAKTRTVAKLLKLKDCSVAKLIIMLKSGWNPNEDSAYLSWLEEYNKNKECLNGT